MLGFVGLNDLLHLIGGVYYLYKWVSLDKIKEFSSI